MNHGEEEVDYGIVEAFYDEKNEIRATTQSFVNPQGETLEELREELQRMLDCLDKLVLDEREMEKYYEKRRNELD